MSLRTGAEMISLSMIFNKVTGFYGLLAILTGFSLSPLQLSMYLYSLAALIILAFLMPHIRRQSPFQCLALAWFYLLDTVINTAFTSAFAITWLLAVSANDANTSIHSSAPGSGTMGDTAGFNNPKYNSTNVLVASAPVGGVQEAVAFATTAARAAESTAGNPTIGHAVGIEETMPSMIVVVILTLVRIYFILVMMAYARQVLRQHIYSSSSSKLHLTTDGTGDAAAENPFAVGTPGGTGWRGKLGRIMVGTGEHYWLGGQADDTWVKSMDGRFKTTKTPSGTLERERRARSGTGPPVPPSNLGKTHDAKTVV